MSDQTSIFGNNTPEATPQQAPQNSTTASTTPQVDDRVATLLADIRNERGEPKYKDPLEALNGLKHAQEYIPQLKSQLTDREALIQQQAAEIERLRQVELSVQQLTQQQEPPPVTNQPTAGMSAEQIAELVQQQLTAREQAALQQANLTNVVSTLQATLGADAEQVFYSKAAELGMTQEEINRLAATKPKAVLTMFGITDQPKAPKQGVAPNVGTVNTSAFQPQQETFIGRNPNPVLIGATTDDLRKSSDRAKNMVEELAKAGLTINDLTNPKIYSKYFK